MKLFYIFWHIFCRKTIYFLQWIPYNSYGVNSFKMNELIESFKKFNYVIIFAWKHGSSDRLVGKILREKQLKGGISMEIPNAKALYYRRSCG
jgi:hypothetical protein